MKHTAKTADLLDQILDPQNWPQIEEFLRKATRVANDELSKSAGARPAIKIDVLGALADLSSAQGSGRLQQFLMWNHRFVASLLERNRRAAADTYDFVYEAMPRAMFRANQMEIVEAKATDILRLGGTILDLGVYKGGSTRSLARIFSPHTIHGFDSFEGLPEDWSHVLKGAFGELKGALPDMPENVKLYKGWFEDTLPEWFRQHGDEPISLLRVDCDIYSSTKTIFDVVGSRVQSGTWILFDELIGYHGWRQHEHKAFQEFLAARPELEFEYVAFGLTYAIGYVK
jgi:hypothetical protein